MHFSLIQSSVPSVVLDVPANAGYDYAKVISALRTRGGDTYDVIDTAGMSDDERWALYSKAAAGIGNRYRISQTTGSRNHKGQFFGAGVPVLLEYAKSDDPFPTGGWPHDETPGGVVTIADFLGIG